MDAKEVLEKILSDANREVSEIKKLAGEKQAADEAEHKRQLEQYHKETEILSQKAGQDKRSHLLAAARMEIAKQLLAEKAAILEEVFSQAQTELKKLSDADYTKLCNKLMLEAVETGDEEVIVDENEIRIDQEFIKNINRELGTGFKGNLRLSNQKRSIGGGFLLRRGRITTNVSFDVLISQARSNLEIELANDLFGN